MTTQKVRIYTCQKHPHWSLESTAPIIAAGLKTFCPLCRDEFWANAIGEADMRVEVRTVDPEPEPQAPASPVVADLFA